MSKRAFKTFTSFLLLTGHFLQIEKNSNNQWVLYTEKESEIDFSTLGGTWLPPAQFFWIPNQNQQPVPGKRDLKSGAKTSALTCPFASLSYAFWDKMYPQREISMSKCLSANLARNSLPFFKLANKFWNNFCSLACWASNFISGTMGLSHPKPFTFIASFDLAERWRKGRRKREKKG